MIFLKCLNIDTPRVFELEHDLEDDYCYPLFMKPLDGSASIGVFKINSKKELLFFRRLYSEPDSAGICCRRRVYARHAV